MSSISLKNVRKAYGKEEPVIENLDLEIKDGSFTVLVGPSGCGKSTLLRAVNLMHNLYPNIRVDGEILLNGENILSM